jgi:hypothetical protein
VKGNELFDEIVEDIPGPSTEEVISLAERNRVCDLAGSICEKWQET